MFMCLYKIIQIHKHHLVALCSRDDGIKSRTQSLTNEFLKNVIVFGFIGFLFTFADNVIRSFVRSFISLTPSSGISSGIWIVKSAFHLFSP